MNYNIVIDLFTQWWFIKASKFCGFHGIKFCKKDQMDGPRYTFNLSEIHWHRGCLLNFCLVYLKFVSFGIYPDKILRVMLEY